MRAHVIENGVVVNTILVESLDAMPNLVEATEGSIGWVYDGSSLIDPNAPTQEEKDLQKAAYMREYRNSLLRKTDWMAGQDLVMTEAQKAYRQALRDITLHPNWPYLTESDWPTKPE